MLFPGLLTVRTILELQEESPKSNWKEVNFIAAFVTIALLLVNSSLVPTQLYHQAFIAATFSKVHQESWGNNGQPVWHYIPHCCAVLILQVCSQLSLGLPTSSDVKPPQMK